MEQSIRACRICGIVKPENGSGKRPTMCRDCYNSRRRERRSASAPFVACVECGGEFKRIHSGDKICSRACRSDWDRKRRGAPPLKTVSCRGCGQNFKQKRSDSRHCSTRCMDAAKYRAKANDPEFIAARRAYAREARARDPELTATKDAARREKYRESHRIASARWSRENRHRITVSWRRRHPVEHAQKQRRRYALLRNLTPIAFTHQQVMEKMAYWGDRCWMCGGPFQQVDHVKPIAVGGLNILSNLRPACQPCNSAKRAKWFGVHDLNRFIRT